MTRHRLTFRAVLPSVLVLVVVVLAAVGVTALVRADRSRSAAVTLEQIAREVELPAGVTAVGGTLGCPVGGGLYSGAYVRCAESSLPVDVVAQQVQATLSVTADEDAAMTCTTLPSRLPGTWRSCWVHIDRAGHGVSVDLYPSSELVDGRRLLGGSQLKVTSY